MTSADGTAGRKGVLVWFAHCGGSSVWNSGWSACGMCLCSAGRGQCVVVIFAHLRGL